MSFRSALLQYEHASTELIQSAVHETYFSTLAGSFALWVTVFIRKHLFQNQEGQQTPYHPQTLRLIVPVGPIYTTHAKTNLIF